MDDYVACINFGTRKKIIVISETTSFKYIYSDSNFIGFCYLGPCESYAYMPTV